MNYSNKPREGERMGWARKAMATCALSGFLALSPLAERDAHAQEVPRTVTPQTQCTSGQVTDGSNAHNGCLVIRQSSLSAQITVEGPARVNLRFYPVVDPTWFNEQTTTYARNIEYTVGASGAQATPQTFNGSTSMSQATSSSVQAPMAVGTPIDFTVSVPSGSQVITVSRPNGIIEVVSAEAVVERTIQPAVPEHRETRPPVRQEPAPVPQPADEARRVQGQLLGQYMPIRELGRHANDGDMYQLGGFWNIPLHRNVALSLGVGTTSHGLSMQTPEATTGLRTYSAELLAGLFLSFDRHSVYGLVSPGWRMTESHITAGSQRLDNTDHAFQFYGVLGYEYDRYVRARVMLGNDPFVPMAGRLYLALPWTWARTASAEGLIDLDASLMWLHTMRPRMDGQLGSFSLDQDALLMRFPVRVPIYPIGPVVPYLFAAPEYVHSLTGEGNVFNMYLGAALGLDIRPFRLDAYGGSSLQGNPLIMLNASISR
ncbi:MAG TPA: hypothetical protein VLD37_06290 [Candidatus Bilamarchaeum sp.]|nr:hypothetical protein [Candidatus Bilamarchaeum sp.]